jgi:hypothetical protein
VNAEAVANGLAEAAASVGEMVTTWVSVMETIDDDGVRGLWIQTAPGTQRWQMLGLLEAAKHYELQAKES